MINLLPPKNLTAIKYAKANTNLFRHITIISFGLIGLVLVVLGAERLLVQKQANTRALSQANEARIKELEPVQTKAQQLSETINTITRLQSQDVKFSALITQIGSLMPSGSILTGLDFSIEDLNAPLTISAEVESEPTAAILRNNLVNSELFSSADIKTITNKSQAGDNSAAAAASRYKFTTTIEAHFEKDATKQTGGSTP